MLEPVSKLYARNDVVMKQMFNYNSKHAVMFALFNFALIKVPVPTLSFDKIKHDYAFKEKAIVKRVKNHTNTPFTKQNNSIYSTYNQPNLKPSDHILLQYTDEVTTVTYEDWEVGHMSTWENMVDSDRIWKYEDWDFIIKSMYDEMWLERLSYNVLIESMVNNGWDNLIASSAGDMVDVTENDLLTATAGTYEFDYISVLNILVRGTDAKIVDVLDLAKINKSAPTRHAVINALRPQAHTSLVPLNPVPVATVAGPFDYTVDPALAKAEYDKFRNDPQILSKEEDYGKSFNLKPQYTLPNVFGQEVKVTEVLNMFENPWSDVNYEGVSNQAGYSIKIMDHNGLEKLMSNTSYVGLVLNDADRAAERLNFYSTIHMGNVVYQNLFGMPFFITQFSINPFIKNQFLVDGTNDNGVRFSAIMILSPGYNYFTMPEGSEMPDLVGKVDSSSVKPFAPSYPTRNEMGHMSFNDEMFEILGADTSKWDGSIWDGKGANPKLRIVFRFGIKWTDNDALQVYAFEL